MTDCITQCIRFTHGHDDSCGCPSFDHRHVDSCRTCRQPLTRVRDEDVEARSVVVIDTQETWCDPTCMRLDQDARSALAAHTVAISSYADGRITEDDFKRSRYALRKAYGRVDSRAGETDVEHDLMVDLRDGLLVASAVAA